MHVLDSYGLRLSPDEVRKHFTGLQDADIRNLAEARWGVSLPENFTELIQEAEWAEMIQNLQPISGAESAVRVVAQSGIATCVASNGSPEEIEHRLKLTGLFPCFEGRQFSAMSVPNPKPHPDVFLHAASSMGFPPAECVVIEDSDPGIKAGLAAGMRVLAFTAASDTAFADTAGVQTFTDMASLPALLGL